MGAKKNAKRDLSIYSLRFSASFASSRLLLAGIFRIAIWFETRWEKVLATQRRRCVANRMPDYFALLRGISIG